MRVTNAFSSPLMGGSPGNHDYTLNVALSDDADHTTGSDVMLDATVDDNDVMKLYNGMEAGASVSLKIIGGLK